MIVHNFNPILIDLGFLEVRWYSISYIVGIILGWLYAVNIINKNSKYKYSSFQNTKKDFDDLIIYLIIGIILGGRLGYVFFYNIEYYIQNFLEIFKIWQGGMSFHGGLVGVIIATLIFSKNKKTSFFIYTDIICCAAPIGLFLGRIANFINGELYGKISNIPWAIIFPQAGNVGRHPSQIYEAILEGLILFAIINFFALKKQMLRRNGYISGLFLILYSLFRSFSEIFREPDKHLGYFFDYFSMGTLLSIVTFLAGCFIIFYIRNNEQNN